MRVELSRFRVLPGKSARVDEWLRCLNDRMDEVLQTLEREQMKIEVVFRERIGTEEYLYWFSVQDEDGEDIGTSPFEVDAIHSAFFDECLDHTDHCRRDALPQVVMVPAVVAKAMQWENPRAASGKFERLEVIIRPRAWADPKAS